MDFSSQDPRHGGCRWDSLGVEGGLSGLTLSCMSCHPRPGGEERSEGPGEHISAILPPFGLCPQLLQDVGGYKRMEGGEMEGVHEGTV